MVERGARPVAAVHIQQLRGAGEGEFVLHAAREQEVGLAVLDRVHQLPERVADRDATGAVVRRPRRGVAVVAAGDTCRKVELDRVNLIHNAEIIATEWDSGFNVQPELQGDALPYFKADAVNLADMKVALGNKPKDFFDSAKNEFTMNPSDHVLTPRYRIKLPQFSAQANGKFYQFDSLDEVLAVLNDPGRKQSIRADSVMEPPTLEYVSEDVVMPDGTHMQVQKQVMGGGQKLVNDASDPAFQAMVRSYTLIAQEIIWQDVTPRVVAEYQRQYEEHHWPWMSQEHWGMSFDPNQFIQMSDKARKLLVRETAPGH